MGFKKFHFQVGFRIAVLGGLLLLFSFCLVSQLYLRAIYLGVFSVISCVELFYYLTKFTRTIRGFLIGVQQSDFSLHFEEREDAFKDVYVELNKVIASFKKVSSEREMQFRFLTMLVEHLSVGIISFDDRKQIHLTNNAFRKLIGKKSFEKFIADAIDPYLMEVCVNMQSGETKSLELTVSGIKRTYAIYASDFKMGNVMYKLRSLQDITDELSVKEIESWAKLMRVLTHEIMNSISPIVSLSDTLFGMVERGSKSIGDETLSKSLTSGLDAIRIRGKGLQQFTDAYRLLSKMPTPVFASIGVKPTIDNMINLVREEFKLQHIELTIDISEETINADRALFEQSILNLLQNAIEACVNVASARVAVVGRRKGDYYEINIIDNGPGIGAQASDKIFVPFFTTKKNGNGIGLAMSRQIIQLHGGDIIFTSTPGLETTFTVKLPLKV